MAQHRLAPRRRGPGRGRAHGDDLDLRLLAALGEPLNLITIVLGPMLLAMSAVYGVQVLARYDLLTAEIRDAPRAAEACIRDVVLPEMISGVTTIIGFAALLVAPQPAIQDFALFSIFGVSAMQLIAVTGLPALLAMLPLPPSRPSARRGRGADAVLARAIDAFLARMAMLATTWPTTILVVWAVLIAAAAAAIPATVVDTDYLSFFDHAPTSGATSRAPASASWARHRSTSW
jgi:predicted RND superfamily exporter protein